MCPSCADRASGLKGLHEWERIWNDGEHLKLEIEITSVISIIQCKKNKSMPLFKENKALLRFLGVFGAALVFLLVKLLLHFNFPSLFYMLFIPNLDTPLPTNQEIISLNFNCIYKSLNSRMVFFWYFNHVLLLLDAWPLGQNVFIGGLIRVFSVGLNFPLIP